MKGGVFILLAVMVVEAAAVDNVLSRGGMEIAFDPLGTPCRVVIDGELVLSSAEETAPFAFDVKKPSESQLKLEGYSCKSVGRPDRDTIRFEVSNGEWTCGVYTKIEPERRLIRRWLDFVWNGPDKCKFKSIMLPMGTLPSADGVGGYFEPARFPPHWKPASEFSGFIAGTTGTRLPAMMIAEGANGWSLVLGVDQLRSYADYAQSFVREGVSSMSFSVNFWSCGYARPHIVQMAGDCCMMFSKCDREQMLLRVSDWYRAIGQHVPSDRPEWVKSVVLYSMDPCGTQDCGFGEWGGFGPAREYLPHIAALGVNTIWLRPVEDWKPYMPRDYYRLRPEVGTEEDAKAFIAEAHARGLRVWRDAVMHGGRRDFPRAIEHPEWLAWKEDGSVLERFGYDYNYPTWVDYFAEIIRDQTRKYALDGWRLDIPAGSKTPNWNPDIPYARASYAKLQGGIAQQRAIRAAMKSVNPDAADLAESNCAVHGNTADSIYDQPLCHSHLLSLREGPVDAKIATLRRWLHEQRCAYVPDTVMMRYVESHDSLRADLLYGNDACDALMALTAFIEGIPLVLQEGEVGHFESWRRIFAARRKIPELTGGVCDYLTVRAPQGVFPLLREKDGCASVVLVNLMPDRVTGTVDWGGGMFACDLGPFAWDVVRVKGPRVDLVCEPAYSPSRAYAQNVHGPLVCDLSGTPIPTGYQVVSNKTSNGVLWCVSASGTADVDRVQLVFPVRNARRWFARSLDGLAEGPFVPYRPFLKTPYQGGTYHMPREGAVVWDSRFHPIGFNANEACVGAVTDEGAVCVTGFQPGQTVRLYDCIAGEQGLWVGLFGEKGMALKLEVHNGVTANTELGIPDARVRPVVGGWRYDDGMLRVQFMRNGALVGAWRRKGASWRQFAGLGTLWCDLGRPGFEQATQANEFDAMMKFERTCDGGVSFEITEGCLRHTRKAGRLKSPDIRYGTRYEFDPNGSFSIRTEVRNPKKIASAGTFEYRLNDLSLEEPEEALQVSYGGCELTRKNDKSGCVRFIWMDLNGGTVPCGSSDLCLRFERQAVKPCCLVKTKDKESTR